MSAILPPAERLWYRHPIDRVEGTWIAIALIWCLVMFAMMVGWHMYGKQNLSTETYRTTPEKFSAKAQAVVDKYTVRTETADKIPVVAPPAGSDVYMIARLWNFWPIIELAPNASWLLSSIAVWSATACIFSSAVNCAVCAMNSLESAGLSGSW